MSLAEFTKEEYNWLASGSNQIAVGAVRHADAYYEVMENRRAILIHLVEGMRGF